MSKIQNYNKILVIVGPTGSGKTGLAVKLAYKYDGEVISADSRQVYKGMDIGTGKDLDEYKFTVTKNKRKKTVKIPYHLIDVVSPKTEFSLGKFYKKANRAMEDIVKREKLPIIAGGTGLYTQALVDGFELSEVKADDKLREKLEKWDVERLYKKLKDLDSEYADSLNESDKKNKRRLIRYIEIAKVNKIVPKAVKKNNKFEYLILGIKWPREVLLERIYKRLLQRLNNEDMIGEIERLHRNDKVSWKRLESFGLEYKFISYYLKGEMGYNEMVEKLNIAIRQFAKRQMTWYRRWEKQGIKIHWVKDYKDANEKLKKFLEK